MKILSARMHGYLDYFVVLVFLAAPTLLSFSGIAAIVSYTLAGVHLVLTLLTAFPLGLVKVIPLKIHGLIELIVGPCLVALPFVLGFSGPSLFFCPAAGVVIFLVWVLTDYKAG